MPGHLVLVPGVADADPHPAEVVADMRVHGADAVMAGGAAADLHLDLERRQIELVVEDRDVLRRLLEEIHRRDRKSTRLNSSHANISYAVFCLKKKNILSSPTY